MTVFVMFLFVSSFDVKAGNFPEGRVTTECIYSDGGIYSFSSSNPDYTAVSPSDMIVNRSPYPLDGSNQSQQSIAGDIFYTNLQVNGLPFTCPSQISKYYLESGSDKEKKTEIYIKLGASFEPGETLQSTTKCFIFCWNKDSKVDDLNFLTNHKLVSENFLVSKFTGANNIYYYQRESKACTGEELKNNKCVPEQASTTREYITIYVFDNIVLLSKNDRTTRVPNSSIFNRKTPPSTIYINDPSPQTMLGGDGRSVNYFIDKNTTFDVAEIASETFNQRYVMVDDPGGTSDTRREQICDKIPATAKVLRTVIAWIRIAVPVLLILFTSIDITRIVISGNPEEDLPKRKKGIISRMIIAVSIFFLPTIVSLILGMFSNTGDLNTDEIQAIDCLFTEVRENSIDVLRG